MDPNSVDPPDRPQVPPEDVNRGRSTAREGTPHNTRGGFYNSQYSRRNMQQGRFAGPPGPQGSQGPPGLLGTPSSNHPYPMQYFQQGPSRLVGPPNPPQPLMGRAPQKLMEIEFNQNQLSSFQPNQMLNAPYHQNYQQGSYMRQRPPPIPYASRSPSTTSRSHRTPQSRPRESSAAPGVRQSGNAPVQQGKRPASASPGQIQAKPKDVPEAQGAQQQMGSTSSGQRNSEKPLDKAAPVKLEAPLFSSEGTPMRLSVDPVVSESKIPGPDLTPQSTPFVSSTEEISQIGSKEPPVNPEAMATEIPTAPITSQQDVAETSQPTLGNLFEALPSTSKATSETPQSTHVSSTENDSQIGPNKPVDTRKTPLVNQPSFSSKKKSLEMLVEAMVDKPDSPQISQSRLLQKSHAKQDKPGSPSESPQSVPSVSSAEEDPQSGLEKPLMDSGGRPMDTQEAPLVSEPDVPKADATQDMPERTVDNSLSAPYDLEEPEEPLFNSEGTYIGLTTDASGCRGKITPKSTQKAHHMDLEEPLFNSEGTSMGSPTVVNASNTKRDNPRIDSQSPPVNRKKTPLASEVSQPNVPKTDATQDKLEQATHSSPSTPSQALYTELDEPLFDLEGKSMGLPTDENASDAKQDNPVPETPQSAKKIPIVGSRESTVNPEEKTPDIPTAPGVSQPNVPETDISRNMPGPSAHTLPSTSGDSDAPQFELEDLLLDPVEMPMGTQGAPLFRWLDEDELLGPYVEVATTSTTENTIKTPEQIPSESSLKNGPQNDSEESIVYSKEMPVEAPIAGINKPETSLPISGEVPETVLSASDATVEAPKATHDAPQEKFEESSLDLDENTRESLRDAVASQPDEPGTSQLLSGEEPKSTEEPEQSTAEKTSHAPQVKAGPASVGANKMPMGSQEAPAVKLSGASGTSQSWQDDPGQTSSSSSLESPVLAASPQVPSMSEASYTQMVPYERLLNPVDMPADAGVSQPNVLESSQLTSQKELSAVKTSSGTSQPTSCNSTARDKLEEPLFDSDKMSTKRPVAPDYSDPKNLAIPVTRPQEPSEIPQAKPNGIPKGQSVDSEEASKERSVAPEIIDSEEQNSEQPSEATPSTSETTCDDPLSAPIEPEANEVLQSKSEHSLVDSNEPKPEASSTRQTRSMAQSDRFQVVQAAASHQREPRKTSTNLPESAKPDSSKAKVTLQIRGRTPARTPQTEPSSEASLAVASRQVSKRTASEALEPSPALLSRNPQSRPTEPSRTPQTRPSGFPAVAADRQPVAFTSQSRPQQANGFPSHRGDQPLTIQGRYAVPSRMSFQARPNEMPVTAEMRRQESSTSQSRPAKVSGNPQARPIGTPVAPRVVQYGASTSQPKPGQSFGNSRPGQGSRVSIGNPTFPGPHPQIARAGPPVHIGVGRRIIQSIDPYAVPNGRPAGPPPWIANKSVRKLSRIAVGNRGERPPQDLERRDRPRGVPEYCVEIYGQEDKECVDHVDEQFEDNVLSDDDIDQSSPDYPSYDEIIGRDAGTEPVSVEPSAPSAPFEDFDNSTILPSTSGSSVAPIVSSPFEPRAPLVERIRSLEPINDVNYAENHPDDPINVLSTSGRTVTTTILDARTAPRAPANALQHVNQSVASRAPLARTVLLGRPVPLINGVAPTASASTFKPGTSIAPTSNAHASSFPVLPVKNIRDVNVIDSPIVRRAKYGKQAKKRPNADGSEVVTPKKDCPSAEERTVVQQDTLAAADNTQTISTEDVGLENESLPKRPVKVDHIRDRRRKLVEETEKREKEAKAQQKPAVEIVPAEMIIEEEVKIDLDELLQDEFAEEDDKQVPYEEWGELQWDEINDKLESPFVVRDAPKTLPITLGRAVDYSYLHEVPETPMEVVDNIGAHFERKYEKILMTFYPSQVFYGEVELDITTEARVVFLMDEGMPKLFVKLSDDMETCYNMATINKITMAPSLVRGFPPCLILSSNTFDEQMINLSPKIKRSKFDAYGQPIYQCHPSPLFFVLNSDPDYENCQCTVRVETLTQHKTYRISALAGFDVLDCHVQLNYALHPRLINMEIVFNFLLDSKFWDYVLHLRMIWIFLIAKNGKGGWMAKCREDLEMQCDSSFVEMNLTTGLAFSLYPPTHRYKPLQRESHGSLYHGFECREAFPLRFREYSETQHQEVFEEVVEDVVEEVIEEVIEEVVEEVVEEVIEEEIIDRNMHLDLGSLSDRRDPQFELNLPNGSSMSNGYHHNSTSSYDTYIYDINGFPYQEPIIIPSRYEISTVGYDGSPPSTSSAPPPSENYLRHYYKASQPDFMEPRNQPLVVNGKRINTDIPTMCPSTSIEHPSVKRARLENGNYAGINGIYGKAQNGNSNLAHPFGDIPNVPI